MVRALVKTMKRLAHSKIADDVHGVEVCPVQHIQYGALTDFVVLLVYVLDAIHELV